MSEVTNHSLKQAPKTGIWAMLAVAGTAIAGTAVFMENADKIGTSAHKACQGLGFCAADPTPVPALAGYDSPEMKGGHSQGEQCNPLLTQYQAAYPKFRIDLQSWEDNNKDWVGHVTYHYHCRYAATEK